MEYYLMDINLIYLNLIEIKLIFVKIIVLKVVFVFVWVINFVKLIFCWKYYLVKLFNKNLEILYIYVYLC